MKKLVAACAMTFLMAVAATPQSTPAAPPKHHVVFQLNEAQGPEWDAVIRHTTNLRKAFEKDGGAQVEIVFYSQGLKMLLKTNKEYEEKLKKLADDGVILAACQNAMKAMNIKTEDLFPFTVQVDSGVAEIARKQEAGGLIFTNSGPGFRSSDTVSALGFSTRTALRFRNRGCSPMALQFTISA